MGALAINHTVDVLPTYLLDSCGVREVIIMLVKIRTAHLADYRTFNGGMD